MRDLVKQASGAYMVPEPVCQLGIYELDLFRLYYFGWVNTFSLGLNFCQQQFVQRGEIVRQ